MLRIMHLDAYKIKSHSNLDLRLLTSLLWDKVCVAEKLKSFGGSFVCGNPFVLGRTFCGECFSHCGECFSHTVNRFLWSTELKFHLFQGKLNETLLGWFFLFNPFSSFLMCTLKNLLFGWNGKAEFINPQLNPLHAEAKLSIFFFWHYQKIHSLGLFVCKNYENSCFGGPPEVSFMNSNGH